MQTVASDMDLLKQRLKAAWMAGDYGRFAKFMERGAMEFLERLGVSPGARLLDAACGAGQIAIPAARAGARATGADIATNLVEQARDRAQMEGLDVHFDEADVELLPYRSGSFDIVVSLVGAMFAPRPHLVAAELKRVCRPAGRIVMANWTPEGFVGQMFQTICKHSPPMPLMPSPLLWGIEASVRERLGEGIAALSLTKRIYPFCYPFRPSAVVDFYRAYHGPTNRSFAALDAAGRTALHRDLEELWTRHNRATDGTTRYDAEYLEVVAVKA